MNYSAPGMLGRLQRKFGVELTAFAALVVAVVVVLLVLRPGGHSQSATQTGATPAAPPPPPPSAVVLARQDGDLAVALAARPARGGVGLTATVLSPDGGGLSGVRVRFAVRPSRGPLVVAPATSCGPGCYEAFARLTGRPLSVVVTLASAGRRASDVRFALPARWRPPAAGALLRRTRAAFARLRNVTLQEHLASSPRNAIKATFRLAAPDRLAYTIDTGAAAVVIGARRWDRVGRGPWSRSPQQPLRQPALSWRRAANAYVLGDGRANGRPVFVASFFDPGIPAWFTVFVDRSTMLPREVHMTAAAHFMVDRYSRFNTTAPIRPPRP